LIEHVQKVILEKYNKKIETEVRIIGRWKVY
jgi:UDP-N-acetylenolpyruvoylglucosamine reductase